MVNAEKVPPTGVLDLAFRKATHENRWCTVTWDVRLQAWHVPSATAAGVVYTVRRVRRDRFARWWLTLACDCPTDTLNHRAVCWHKAAVVLRWTHRRKDAPTD